MSKPKYVVFIVIDTLRASSLGAYGYPKPTSPTIDRLASEGVLFESCFAPGIPTTPAHTTIYTGLHPITHNIVCHGGSADLDRKIPVLPELMQRSGFTTAACDNLADIKPWLARGYEFYINSSHQHKMRLLVTCEEINARALPWIRCHKEEPFFLFIHYWDPHTPYIPPPQYRNFYPSDRDPFSKDFDTFEPIKKQPFWDMFKDLWFARLGPVTDADYVAALYDAEIRHCDDGVKQILDVLDETGIANETLVVLTGDHGESMYQHDIYFDHHGLYDDITHVPLIMRHRNSIEAGRRISGLSQHLDIAPTILEAVESKVATVMDGKSLWPAATGLSDRGPWNFVVSCENTWQSKWALRTETHKLIISRRMDHHNMPRRELYDLIEDPLEEHNIADQSTNLADGMEAELELWIVNQLEKNGRMEDPIVAQEYTLGKRWSSVKP